MAYSYNEVVATGSPQLIAVPEYIDQTHIKVRINGVDTTSFSWVNANTVSVTAASGATVRVYRESSPGARVVDFIDGQSLTEAALDNDSKQAFFLTQEQLDATSEALTAYGSLDAALAEMVAIRSDVDADSSTAASAAAAAAASEAAVDADAAAATAAAAAAGAAAGTASAAAADAAASAADASASAADASASAADASAAATTVVGIYPSPKMSPWFAVGNGVADDTAAINAFLAAVPRGHIPAGTYKVTGPLNFQSNQVITGDGAGSVLVFAAAVVANQPVLNISGKVNTRVSGLCLQVPAATYTTARSIFIENSSNCHVQDILFSGGAGGSAGFITGSTSCSIKRVWADSYRSNGFYVNGGAGNTIEDCDIPDGTGGQMGVQLVGGEGNAARNNRVAKVPDNYFGVHAWGGNFPVVTGNKVKNTRREAIALGGPQIGARVTNNTCYWDASLGTGDFGMSVAGDDASNIVADFLIADNTIIGSALDGIGIAGWCQRGRVVDNVIRDCAQASAAGFRAGIKLYGWIAGAVTTDMIVENNSVSKVSGGGLLYAVNEEPGLGVVSGNIIRGNRSVGLTGDMYPRSTALRALNDNDLSLRTHSAAVTSAAGSITTASGTLQYSLIGRFVLCRLTVTVTTNGTGSQSLSFPLPFTASSGALSGAEAAVNGKACKAGADGGGTSLTITNYDNTYPGANGVVLVLSGLLELA